MGTVPRVLAHGTATAFRRGKPWLYPAATACPHFPQERYGTTDTTVNTSVRIPWTTASVLQRAFSVAPRVLLSAGLALGPRVRW